MKRKSLLSLALVSLITTGGFAFEFEKGDGLMRNYDFFFDLYDLPFEPWPGHAGMYWDFLEYPPTEPHDQRLIEMQGAGLVLTNTLQTWINHVGEGDVWGVKTMPALTATQRQRLTEIASSFTNAGYSLTNGYKNPLVNPPTFRCDGLVEYAYEYVLGEEGPPGNNGGIVANDEWTSLNPLTMFNSVRWTTRSAGVPPALTIRDASNAEIPNGGMTSDQNISAYATDTNNGSGLTRLEIWQGDPEAGGTLLNSISQDYDVDHTYAPAEIGPLPEGPITIRAYDQAGNRSLVELIIGRMSFAV